MQKPTSILAAVDFSDPSAHAIAAAALIAEERQIPLRLVHAEHIDAPPYFTNDQLETLAQQRRQARADADLYLQRFGRQYTRYPFASVIADGEPARAILDEARAGDLIVMGTHGRRGPSRWWLGSVAERVLRETTHPLLVVRQPLSEGTRFIADVDAVFNNGGRVTGRTLITLDTRFPRFESWLGTTLPVLYIPDFKQGDLS